MSSDFTKESLIAEYRRLADELGHAPTGREMDAHGRYSRDVYMAHFGSWNEAVAESGFVPNTRSQPAAEEEILEEIRRVADELGRTPTKNEMGELGEYTGVTCHNRFGSWNVAVEEAGLEPNKRGGYRGWTNDDLIELLQLVTLDLGKPPEPEDVEEHADIDPDIYLDRWESWWIACSVAGVTAADLESAGVGEVSDQ